MYSSTYEEDFLCPQPARIGIFLAQGDELFGEALGFFGFGPGGLD